MDERFGSIKDRLAPFLEKIGGGIGKKGQFKSKKWLTYGLMMAISLILFLTVGGSRGRPPEGPLLVDPSAATPDAGSGVIEGEEGPVVAPPLDTVGGAPTERIETVHEDWGHDPFAMLEAFRKVSLPPIDLALSLSAISWKDGEGIALINDFIVREGDVVEGAQVIDITSDSVVLNRDGQRFILNLSEGSG